MSAPYEVPLPSLDQVLELGRADFLRNSFDFMEKTFNACVYPPEVEVNKQASFGQIAAMTVPQLIAMARIAADGQDSQRCMWAVQQLNAKAWDGYEPFFLSTAEWE